MTRVGHYRHFLGTWDPAERVRVADGSEWRAADAASLASLGVGDVLVDAAAIAEAKDGILAAMTVPARVKRKLWALEWGETGPSDAEAFATYGRSVVSFFRAAGVPLGGDQPCATKLVAAAPGTTKTTASAVVNVGESECLVADAGVAVRVPPGEACLLSPGGSYTVVVPPDAEFGLLLELG